MATASTVEQAIKESRALLKLKKNWDGEGSLPISRPTWERATRFLRKMSEMAKRRYGFDLPVPYIDPGPQGGIDLHWRKQERFEALLFVPASRREKAGFYADNYKRKSIKGKVDPRCVSHQLLRFLASILR